MGYFEKGETAFYNPVFLFMNIKFNAKFTFHAKKKSKKGSFKHEEFLSEPVRIK